MSRSARTWLFLAAAGVLVVPFGFALAGLPGAHHELGRSADIIVHHGVQLRRANNVVIATAFDFRGFDTLFEEFMIFVAAVGAAVLLRTLRHDPAEGSTQEVEDRLGRDTSALLGTMGMFVPVTVVLGIYVVAHGHLSPGGGFQGGVILAGALVFFYVVGQRDLVDRMSPVKWVEVAHAASAGAFAAIAIGGLILIGAFFANFLPLGRRGGLLSGGTIPLANVAVGLEVAAAFTLVLSELLDFVPPPQDEQ